MIDHLFTKRQWLLQPFSNQLMGAAQCVPRESWKANEPTECASEQQTERLPVAENLLSVTHACGHIFYTHTHTERHLNRDEPISRRQTWAQQIDGGRKKEWATWKNTLKHSVCRQRPERKVQRRHLHTRTLSGKLRWPEEDPSWHSGGIMWQSVWSEWGRHSDIIHTEEEK